jgi:acetyltransferase-like isoleucine patch superfamily enzyme
MSSPNDKYKNRWSLLEIITLGFSAVCTKLFYRKAKLICYPVYMRGKKSLAYDIGLNIGYGCRFDLLNPEKITLEIGKNCEMGDNCHIVAIDSVKIGDNFLAASKIFISDCSHGDYSLNEDCSMPEQPPRERTLKSNPVVIGNNVWIGENVVILAGVHIGDGCIIGANSVVNSSIPENTIAVGSPAKVVKKFDPINKVWEKV